MTRDFKKAAKNLEIAKRDQETEIPGILGFYMGGKQVVEVPTRPGYVFVRLRGTNNEVISAFNDKVSPVYNLPVIVSKDDIDKTRYKVVGRDTGLYTNWGNSSSYLPRHGESHSFSQAPGTGGDIVWVYGKQMMPLAVQPSGSVGAMNVYINNGVYYQTGMWHYAGGTGSLSLASFKPTDDTARMVLVYLDSNGTPRFTGSSSYFDASITGTAGILAYTPSVPDSAYVPLAGIRLVSGTSAIVWDNIYDLRPWVVGDGFIPTGTFAPSDHNHGFVDTLVYDDHAFVTTGTILDFTEDISVLSTGSVAYISVTTGSFSRPSHTHPTSNIVVYDNSVYKTTGTAFSFDNDLSVIVTGSTAYVYIPTGTFSRPGDTAAVGGNTGTFTMWMVDAPPASPTAWDDEFISDDLTDITSLDAGKWTAWIGSDLSDFEVQYGHSRLVYPNATGTFRGITGDNNYTNAGSMSVVAKVSTSYNYSGVEAGQIGVMFTDYPDSGSPTGISHAITLEAVSSRESVVRFAQYKDRTLFSEHYAVTGSFSQNSLYLWLFGGDWLYGYYSVDGINWIALDAGLVASGPSPGVTYYGGLVIKGECWADFYRVVSGATLLHPIQGQAVLIGGAAGTSSTTINNNYGGGNLVIYDDSTYKVTGSAISFADNLSVVVTGSTAYVSSIGGAGNPTPIYDDSVFKVTGSVISFDNDIAVTFTGSSAYVYIPTGTFSRPEHTHPSVTSVSGVGVIGFFVGGELQAGTIRVRNLAPCNGTIENAVISVYDSPTGGNVVVDVEKNGSSIFGSKPTITPGIFKDTSTVPTTTSFVTDDEFILIIDSVGPSGSGSDLQAQLRYVR